MSLRIVMTVIVVTAVLGVAACGGDNEKAGPYGDGGTAVVQVVLPDGVACDTMDGNGKAISCDWQGSKQPVTTSHPKGDGGTGISLLALRNGVHCAVMDGGGDVRHGGGKAIDCDWDGTRDIQTNSDPKGDSGTRVSVVVTSDRRTCAVMDGPGKAISCERTHSK